mmetsp:Transcript_30571/g.103848  ORF Transcript_30571/g.103848 Transcript_30571/m.103848 type:complete len:159 (-) Transcript_30571:59-535(-)
MAPPEGHFQGHDHDLRRRIERLRRAPRDHDPHVQLDALRAPPRAPRRRTSLHPLRLPRRLRRRRRGPPEAGRARRALPLRGRVRTARHPARRDSLGPRRPLDLRHERRNVGRSVLEARGSRAEPAGRYDLLTQVGYYYGYADGAYGAYGAYDAYGACE